ncbi:hypothetical protein FSP39_019185 [Pinctada imbricata]|uniref:Uncharacterized protein n=1 Tax=Pinctada imbricata TaxID=66713 RepID=A0AA89C3V0_PINIB|nr:hypothetical protein FSP39_019185 [Pinctada imbricata]
MDNQFQTVSNSGNQFQNTQFQMTGGQQTLQTGAATAAQPFMQPMDGNGLQTVNSFASPNGQESNVAIQNTVDTAQSITGNANQDGQNSSSNNGNGEVDPNFNGNIVSIGGRIYIVEENGSMTEAPDFAHLVGSTIRSGRIITNILNVQQSGLRSSGNQPNQLGVPTLPPLTVGANGQVLPGPQPIPGNPPMNGQFPINNQISTNGQPAFNGQVPVNGQFPVNNQIPANQPFLMNNQIPFNSQIQGNGRFPVNGPVPFPPRPPMNGPFSPNSLFPIGRRAPVQPPFRGNALPNGPVPFPPNRRFPVPNGGFPNFPRPFPGPPGMIPPLPPGGQFRGPPRPFGPPPNRVPGMPPRQPFFDPRFGK